MKKIKLSRSRLEGHVNISGAKNCVLRLLAASLLTDEEIVLRNYPVDLLDAKIHVDMIKNLGKQCIISNNQILIKTKSRLKNTLNWNDRSIRNTLLILGALTTRLGSGSVPLPGGCKLGERRFDLHELVLRKLGAEVWQEGEMLCSEVKKGYLEGADIHLPLRSTGATENAIITGALARGITRIWNPHIRPEIINLIEFLNSLGAKIKVFGQEHIEIEGVEELNGGSHDVMPDNMEAITWMVGTVITGGDVEIVNFPFSDLEVAMIHLRESGAKYYRGENSLIVRGGKCYPLEISTGPYPGINSDVQPILAAYGANATGESVIIDLRFPGRYRYAEEMAKMGVKYSINGNLLRIQGVGGKLHGATVKALDLRAGAALSLCGLVASGETEIDDAWQIERGYSRFIDKLKALNGQVSVE